MVPALGRTRPIIALRSVLFPQPLPPMMAKIEPVATSNETSCWTIVSPNPTVRSATCSFGPFGWAVIGSDVQRGGANGEDRIQRDHADDADDDRRRGRTPDAGGAAACMQADAASHDGDQRAE